MKENTKRKVKGVVRKKEEKAFQMSVRSTYNSAIADTNLVYFNIHTRKEKGKETVRGAVGRRKRVGGEMGRWREKEGGRREREKGRETVRQTETQRDRDQNCEQWHITAKQECISNYHDIACSPRQLKCLFLPPLSQMTKMWHHWLQAYPVLWIPCGKYNFQSHLTKQVNVTEIGMRVM